MVPPTICCDLCHPDAISRFVPGLTAIINPPKATRKPKQIKVTPYESSMAEQSLKNELLTWRERTACNLFGNIDDFTPNVFLHSSILDRILDLAHAHKIQSVLDLKNQTSWCFAEEYGGDIITLVKRHCPPIQPGQASAPSLFVSTPLRSRPDTINSPTHNTLPPVPLKTRAPPQCGECGIVGHRSESHTPHLRHSHCMNDG